MFNTGSKVTVLLRDRLMHAYIHGVIKEFRGDYLELEEVTGEQMLIPRESIIYLKARR